MPSSLLGGEHTSTVPNFYTGLKLSSKSHFYGRVAPEEVLAVFLSELLRARSARRGFYLGAATVLARLLQVFGDATPICSGHV